MVIQGILDTSIVIDLLRGVGPALEWFNPARHDQMAITPVVWMEVAQGAVDKASLDRAMRFMRRFHLEHPTPDDNIWAMRQFARVRLSHKIDYPDALIASVAARLDVPLYTLNLRHYTLLLGDRAQRPY